MIIEDSYESLFSLTNKDSSNFTHSLHPYPAKFPPFLPKNILQKYSFKGQTVLDPFCGSGTTLVESRIFGNQAIGVDVNGLSVLLSKVKSTSLNFEMIVFINDFIKRIEAQIPTWSSKFRPKVKLKEFEGRSHWFQDNVSEELTFLLNEIATIEKIEIKNFLHIVFSSIVVKVSNQESDTRFVAISKNIQDSHTLELFCKRTKEYSVRMLEYSNVVNNNSSLQVHNADSRNLSFLPDNSIDIIITSPPYANTYDYYLYHKFRKRWLDLDVKYAQYNEIGSRREYSSLKQKKEKWNEDLIKCFSEMRRVLKYNSLSFVVIGDSVIKQELIKIEQEIINFAPKIGFKLKGIVSSDLSKHSKIFNPTYAQKGKKEHLIILEKV